MHRDGTASAAGQYLMVPGAASASASQALTSCPLPASSSRGTSSPSPWSTRASPNGRSLWRGPVRARPSSALLSASLPGIAGPAPAGRIAAGRVVLRATRGGGGVGRGGRSRFEPGRRALPSTSFPHRAHRNASLARPLVLAPAEQAAATPERARTGTFWRFEGRPSFSGAAAPPAFRFAALSMARIGRRVGRPNGFWQAIPVAARVARVQRGVQLNSGQLLQTRLPSIHATPARVVPPLVHVTSTMAPRIHQPITSPSFTSNAVLRESCQSS